MLRANGWDGKSPIRLLSCSTGKLPDGFAQKLADELGVAVKAPNEVLWVSEDGTHFVAPFDPAFAEPTPDMAKLGHFVPFFPRKP